MSSLDEKSSSLFHRIDDAINISQKRPYFLGFLDEEEGSLAEEYLKHRADVSHMLYGGYDAEGYVERQMLGVFPDYLTPSAESFPISPITITFREQDQLSHRDFLGVFMGLGIQRTAVGDILVEDGRAVAFIKDEMLDYFLQNIEKIGRVGVKIIAGAQYPLPTGRKLAELKGVVASSRIDCIVALLAKTSREKAVALINSGLVTLNHREVSSTSVKINEGDKVTIRGKGKFIIESFGRPTGKGRLPVSCKKYM